MLDRPQVHFVVVSDGYPRQPTLEPLEYELLPRELEFETCGRALVHHMNFQHMSVSIFAGHITKCSRTACEIAALTLPLS